MSRHQFGYAIHGIAIGLIASIVLISGAIMLIRFSDGMQIGHRVPIGFALFSMILIVIFYRMRHGYYRRQRRTGRSARSVTRSAVTEFSEGDGRLGDKSNAANQNQTKSA